ncbi:MAG: ABC transporter substrate-binding protein [Alphaproteobacteria bacterium]
MAAAAIVIGGAAAAPAAELSMLTWEGYADASFVKDFEASTACRVTATYVGSNDDFAPKLAAGGGVYDIITPSIDTIGLMRMGGFVEPIDLARLPHWQEIYGRFRDNADVSAGGAVWSVPLVWGSISLMYRQDKVSPPPDSIAVLFDPRYKGRIAMWDDKSSLYWAARLLGFRDIYDLTDDQLAKVQAKLIEQKPLLRKYWATAGELTELYANQEVWLSNTWTGFQIKEIGKLGKSIPLVEFDPKEKSEGWMDSMQIVKGSPNRDCAYKWLDYMTAAKGQCGIAEATGYFPVNPAAVKACLSADELKTRHVGDIGFVSSLVMWQMPKRLDKYIAVWNAVKAAP